jgi:hypothetical protein
MVIYSVVFYESVCSKVRRGPYNCMPIWLGTNDSSWARYECTTTPFPGVTYQSKDSVVFQSKREVPLCISCVNANANAVSFNISGHNEKECSLVACQVRKVAGEGSRELDDDEEHYNHKSYPPTIPGRGASAFGTISCESERLDSRNTN